MSDALVVESLRELAERGTPRGADALYRAASDPDRVLPGPGEPDAGRGRGLLVLEVAAALVVLVLLAVGLVSARRSDPTQLRSGASSTAAPDVRARLLGRQFVSTAITEHGAPKRLPDDAHADLRFDQELEIRAGCNIVSLRWSVDGDVLETAPGTRPPTAMNCTPEREGNTWLVPFLESRPRVALDGQQLRLIGDDAEIVLQLQRTFVPAQPVEGTSWTLGEAHTIVQPGPGESLPVGPSKVPALRLDAGVMTVWTGCVDTTLSYTVRQGPGDSMALIMGPELVPDSPACPGDRRRVHEAIAGTLNERAFPLMPVITGGTLQLRNNSYLLDYTAPVAAPDPSR
jgi:hypothetical protein